MQQPTRLISTPFAQEGEKTEIQNVTGEFDNSATYRLGFPPLTMQSIRLGGKPPKGTDFNGILFDITENISFLCKGGRYQYNAGLSTLIGGYPEGSNLLLDDNVTEVVSTVAGNQNNPNTDMTGWTFKPNRTTAEYVLDASGETQQQVNYNGGAKWYSRVDGYQENERVVLANGDIVKSAVDGNVNDPNTDLTGWVRTNDASQIFDSNTNRNQEKKNTDLVSVKDFGAKGDGVTDDAPALNNYILSTEAEDKRSTYFYFPNYDESYLVNSPINWMYGGVLIFGFKGGTYNTSRKRKGNIVVNNTNCGFNIGADRTLVGITDGWEVRNIGFVQHPDLPVRSADAIRISAKTDGPDRGLTIYGVTSREMNRGIYIPSNSATVMGGTLVIEKCYLNNNNYALVIDQKVEGLRFVGNQAEQNQQGCIDVVINGGVTITDNMLEGQKNAINIRGVRPKVEIKRNYFEANFGDYVVQFSAVSQDSSIELAANYAITINQNTDYFRVVNNQFNYPYKVINEDFYPATFVDDANITPDSRIVNRQVSYYYIKSFNGNRGVKVYNDNWSNLATDNSYTQMTVRGDAVSRFVDTPFGKRQIPNTNDYFSTAMNVAQGDMIAINCLFKVVETSDLATSGIELRVFDQAVTNLIGGEIWSTGFITSALANKYVLFSGVIKASKAATSVLFQMFNSQRDIQMVGACAKNLGQFTDKFKHKQVMPSFDSEFAGTDTLSSVVIADGVRNTRTVTVNGARLGQFVDVSFTANQGGVNIYGFVSATDTVAVVLENRTGTSQTLTGTLRVKTKKSW